MTPPSEADIVARLDEAEADEASGRLAEVQHSFAIYGDSRAIIHHSANVPKRI